MIENLNQDQLEKFPPHPYIEQLSNHAHACIKTYYKLWKERDEKNIVYIDQTTVPTRFNLHTQKFQRDIIDLCEEKLCNWRKTKKKGRYYYQIELVGWANDEAKN